MLMRSGVEFGGEAREKLLARQQETILLGYLGRGPRDGHSARHGRGV